ncbi:STAS domain-containing protein [Streptomyces sp. NPDC003717]|uniref:STAS domain-containing protein n=1 Tax=Streptomyces sp. NPDC003717 TaxID=3154276 RepID=UPI0033AE17D0
MAHTSRQDTEDQLLVAVTVTGEHGLVEVTGASQWRDTALVQAALNSPDLLSRRSTYVDLSGLSFADSSVLHALLEAQRAHRARGAAFALVGTLQPVVDRLFTLTGAGQFLTHTPRPPSPDAGG